MTERTTPSHPDLAPTDEADDGDSDALDPAPLSIDGDELNAFIDHYDDEAAEPGLDGPDIRSDAPPPA